MWSSFVLAVLTSASADAPTGDYVEARTASVYAGACHAGGEYTTQGREALLAWSIERGTFAGVDLGGATIAAVVSSPANLDAGGERSSVVHLDRDAPAEALAWLLAEHGQRLGRVQAVVVGDVTLARAGDAFALAAGDGIELTGALLPDRACCSMPFGRWYDPLAPVDTPIVGRATLFRVDEPRLGTRFARRGENVAFAARF